MTTVDIYKFGIPRGLALGLIIFCSVCPTFYDIYLFQTDLLIRMDMTKILLASFAKGGSIIIIHAFVLFTLITHKMKYRVSRYPRILFDCLVITAPITVLLFFPPRFLSEILPVLKKGWWIITIEIAFCVCVFLSRKEWVRQEKIKEQERQKRRTSLAA